MLKICIMQHTDESKSAVQQATKRAGVLGVPEVKKHGKKITF